MALNIYILYITAICGDHCKCLSGTGKLDGKTINKEGYCEYQCQLLGYCGNDQTVQDYLKGIDCTSCKKENDSRKLGIFKRDWQPEINIR